MSKSKRSLHQRRLGCESLEDRRMLATFVVDSLEDSGPGTLREAITLANDTPDVADIIQFEASLFDEPRAILLEDQLPWIRSPLAIHGPGADLLAIDGQHGTDGVPSTGDGWALLKGSNLASGLPYSIELTGVTFQNSDQWHGEALEFERTSLFASQVAFRGNHDTALSIQNNGADGPGVYIVDAVFENNATGISVSEASLTVENTDFLSNTSGAIRSVGSAVVVSHSEFRDNQADYGGAIHATMSRHSRILPELRVDSTLFVGNRAEQLGGAIHAENFYNDNDDEDPDSAIFEVNRSTFVGNETGSSGGAISLNDVPAEITIRPAIVNSTFTENVATSAGAILTDGPTDIRHSTLYNHRVGHTEGGTVYSTDLGSLHVSHSIIAGTKTDDPNPWYPFGPEIYATDFGGPIFPILVSNSPRVFTEQPGPTVSYSIIGFSDRRIIDSVGNILGGAGRLQANPNLSPLGYQGGNTPTFALMPGSIAIDAGDPLMVLSEGVHDQRGGPYRRIAGAAGQIDIGAYEAQGAVSRAPGDFNGDGSFDAADYTVWRKTEGFEVAPYTLGDATGDGLVNEIDLGLWRARYGEKYFFGPIIVNDTGVHDDRDIFNGRTTLTEAINFTNESEWIDTIVFDPSLSGDTIDYSDYHSLYSYAQFNLTDDLTIDATSLPDGITITNDGEPFLYVHENIRQIGSNPSLFLDISPRVRLAGLSFEGVGGVIDLRRTIARFKDIDLDDPNIVLDRVHIRNSTFDAVNAGEPYFALGKSVVRSEGPVLVVDSTIERARSSDGLGRGPIHSLSSVTLIRSEIVDSSGGVSVGQDIGAREDETGRFFNQKSQLKIIDSTIRGSTDRPAVIARGDVSIVNSHIDGNHHGGIVAYVYEREFGDELITSGPVQLVDSTVSGNTLPWDAEFHEELRHDLGGGGITTATGLMASRSRIEGNTNLRGAGGGIASLTTLRLDKTVVSGNYALGSGAIYVAGERALWDVAQEWVPQHPGDEFDRSWYWHDGFVMTHGTVEDNRAEQGTAGITVRGGVVQIENSSISRNVFIENSDYYYGNDYIGGLDATGNLKSYDGRGDVYYYYFDRDLPVTITDSIIEGNGGQGVLAYYKGAVEITRSRVIDNLGGGVTATYVADSVISGNTGEVPLRGPLDQDFRTIKDGAGVTILSPYLFDSDGTLPIQLERSVVEDNGGVGVLHWASVGVVRDTIITGNSHGGIYGFDFYGYVFGRSEGYHLIDVQVVGNSIDNRNTLWRAGTPSAAVSGSNIYLERVNVSDNTATIYGDEGVNSYELQGGGVSGSDVTIVDSTIQNNSLTGINVAVSGAGIAANGLTLADSTVRDNVLSGKYATGGGISVNGATIYGSTVSNNTVHGDLTEGKVLGGGIAADHLVLYQSTVSGNHAEGYEALGGGIAMLDTDSTASIVHSTIVKNSVEGEILAGGGGLTIRTLPHIEGSVIAGNLSSGTSPDVRVRDLIDESSGEEPEPRLRYSLIGDTSGSPIDAMTGPGNLLNIDPMLGPLSDNGGPTETHLPLTGSPLIDAGDPGRIAVPLEIRGRSPLNIPLTFAGDVDQRGVGHERHLAGIAFGEPRIDIGAVEIAGVVMETASIEPAIALSPLLTEPPQESKPPLDRLVAAVAVAVADQVWDDVDVDNYVPTDSEEELLESDAELFDLAFASIFDESDALS